MFNREPCVFRPAHTMSRAWILKALLEAWNLAPLRSFEGVQLFDDVPTSHEAAPYIYAARQEGIISGDGAVNEYRPNDPVNREDIFVMLHRVFESSVNAAGKSIPKPIPVATDFTSGSSCSRIGYRYEQPVLQGVQPPTVEISHTGLQLDNLGILGNTYTSSMQALISNLDPNVYVDGNGVSYQASPFCAWEADGGAFIDLDPGSAEPYCSVKWIAPIDASAGTAFTITLYVGDGLGSEVGDTVTLTLPGAPTDPTEPTVTIDPLPIGLVGGQVMEIAGSVSDPGDSTALDVGILSVTLSYSADNGTNWIDLGHAQLLEGGRWRFNWFLPRLNGEIDVRAVATNLRGNSATTTSVATVEALLTIDATVVDSYGQPMENARVILTGGGLNIMRLADNLGKVHFTSNDDDLSAGTAYRLDADRDGLTAFADNLVLTPEQPALYSMLHLDTASPLTVASPAGGVFVEPRNVTLSCSDDRSGCAMTHYTVDGSTPTTSSPVYSGPIIVSDTTLRFFSVDQAGNAEEVRVEVYELAPLPELTVSLTDTPDPVDAGAVVAVDVIVGNIGQGVGTQITTDFSTTGMIQSVSGAGWTCSATTTTSACTLDFLEPGTTAPITVQVVAPNEGGSLLHDAIVTATEVAPANVTATAATTVLALADVSLEIVLPNVATLDLPFNASVVVHNSGPSIATNVTLALGGTLDLISAATVDVGTLAPGTSQTVSVSLSSSSLGNQTVEATATALETDPVADNTATASILVTKDGLSGYWPFDEVDGDVAIDTTGRGNDGIIVGAVRTTGVRGRALNFSGDSNHARLPGNMSRYVEDHFTVALWAKVTNVKSHNYLFHDNDDRPGIRLDEENRPTFSYRPNGTVAPFPIATSDDRTPLPIDEWLHVAIRWDGVTYSAHVDGHRVFAVELPFFELGNRLMVGSDGSVVRSFEGLIDEVRIYNRALAEDEIQTLATDLVGHWKFDETSGDVVVDNSGNRNDGILVNDSGSVWQRTEGAVGGGIDLKATNYVAIPDDGSLSLQDVMTVEAWVQVRTSPARFVQKTASFSGNADNYSLGTNASGAFLFHIEDSNGGKDWAATSTTVAQPGTWHHVAGVYNGQELLIYVDGILEGMEVPGPIVPYTGDADLVLGTNQFSTHRNRWWTDGLIDDVRIYRRALSGEEIALHAAATVGWWRFEEPEGGRVFDSSGNFHDGDLSTVNGTPWQRVLGAVGQGIDFTDGENQIRIPDEGSFSLTRPFTIESWVKARQPFARVIVKTAREGANNDNYNLVTSDTGVYRFQSSGGEDLDATAATASCTSRFHHVAGTFDGEALHIYVDGVLEATKTTGPFTPYTGSYDLLLGTNSHPGRSSVHWTDGVLDEVAIHARPLSAAQIASRASAGPDHPAPSGEISSPTGTARGHLTVEASASDVDGLAEVYVTFIDGGAPLFLCGDSGSPACAGGTGTWRLSDVDPQAYGASAAGPLTLKLFVRDGCGEVVQVSSAEISWAPVNRAPVLDPVGGPFTVGPGTLLSFTATATDPDGQGLTFSLEQAPAGAAIDPQTGIFTWTPASDQGSQTYFFDLVVFDDDLTEPLSDHETIEVTVEITDSDPPTVVRLDTISGTGDGVLTACETAQVEITEFQVTFSEALQDPPGDSDPDDVTNPENYLLLAAGPDQDFGTELCGTLFGDDQPVVLSSVSWDATSHTATLRLADTSLDDAPYRLIACGSTSLYDLAGNPLDGDGDGTGGDDFFMDFRVDADNAFDNGHLDCGLNSWIPTSVNAGEIVHSSEDVDESSFSGSVQISNLTSSTTFTISQCVPVEGESLHRLSAKLRFEAAADVRGSLSGACEYFDTVACFGESFGIMDGGALQIEDTAEDWVSFEGTWMSPMGSASAMCIFSLLVPGGESFDAYLDRLVLREGELIFEDDFESGNTSVWNVSQ